MHKSNFVVAVQDSTGMTLRERGEEIRLPFGSEYKIYLKNNEGRKARVNIHINGQDVLDGNTFIIDPNSTSTIEGYMKGNVVTHRFKFIQKTEQIVEFQGDNPEHGFIRVEVQFEKRKPIIRRRITDSDHVQKIHYHYHYHNDSLRCPRCGCKPCCCLKWTYGSGDLYKGQVTIGSSNMNYSSNSSLGEDEGLTVAGSEINETLDYSYIGALEPNTTVFTFRMLGVNQNGHTPINKPVLTRTNIQCTTCGKQNPTQARFCMACGTSLTY